MSKCKDQKRKNPHLLPESIMKNREDRKEAMKVAEIEDIKPFLATKCHFDRKIPRKWRKSSIKLRPDQLVRESKETIF